MRKIYVSWEEFDKMILELTKKIKEDNTNYNGIFGVPRGGLPIAVYLSHNLGLPLLLYPTKETLVVDDISDTGKTLKYMNKKKTACLFSTDWTICRPDFYIKLKERKTDWIVYPWEEKIKKEEKE